MCAAGRPTPYRSALRWVKLAGLEIIPALDLRRGAVVRLGLQGDFGTQTEHGDPMARAAGYVQQGARRLHVVDLDAASGAGSNRDVVRALVRASGVPVQVAGGIRDAAGAAGWLEAGAAVALMGTTAARTPAVLVAAAEAHPGRVGAALDLRGGRPAVAGWSAVEERSLEDLLAAWDPAPLAAVVVTSVDRDGSLAGPDLEALARVRALTRHPVIYSGGVGNLDDIGRLAGAGAAGVILGRALLEGRFTLAEAMLRCAAG